MIKKAFLIVLSLMLAKSILFAAQPLQTRNYDLATEFKLSDLENKEFSLSSLKGKPVILFFWTTWCPFCRKELKTLKDKYPQLVKDGWELFAIDVAEPAYKVDSFIKSYSLNFKVLLDKDTAVVDSYDILGVPTYVLIDKKGQVVFKDHYFPQATYKDLIKEDE